MACRLATIRSPSATWRVAIANVLSSVCIAVSISPGTPVFQWLGSPALSRRARMRKPSCLISCSQPGPEGGALAGEGRQGSMIPKPRRVRSRNGMRPLLGTNQPESRVRETPPGGSKLRAGPSKPGHKGGSRKPGRHRVKPGTSMPFDDGPEERTFLLSYLLRSRADLSCLTYAIAPAAWRYSPRSAVPRPS
jgi:hypothetical protein